MRVMEITNQDLLTMDTLSGIRDETVEIWERETIRTINLGGHAGHHAQQVSVRRPKLIIDDEFAQTRVFVTKARSQGSFVDSVLREVMGKEKR